MVPLSFIHSILDYEFAGTLIHETIGHLAEADNLTSNLYKEFKGKQVASEILNVCDDPRYKDLKGSYLFDDQGENAQSTVLCNHGALCNFLSDRKTSELYDIPITGNSRSINYSHLPLVRMSNLFVQPGETDLDEMIGNIDYGLFVVGAKSAITNNAQFENNILALCDLSTRSTILEIKTNAADSLTYKEQLFYEARGRDVYHLKI